MRPVPTLARLALCLTSLSSLTWAHGLDANDGLAIRQNDGEESTRTTDEERTTITQAPTSTDGDSPRSTNTGDDEETTRTRDEDEETTSRRSSQPTRTRFAPDAPPGGVSLMTPVTLLDPTPLVKMNDWATFAWNYTSLRGTPQGIDVLVSCSTASATWTLTSNMSFDTSVEFLWDTREQVTDAQQPLVEHLYTLIVKDSEADITDIPDPGYLAAYTGLTFGVYRGAEPTDYADWRRLNSAAPSLDRHATGFAISMGIVTVLSFTWFVGGLGLH